MKFYDRSKKTKGAGEPCDLSIIEFGKILFEEFSEGFVLAGYGKETHFKFLLMSGIGKVYQDAFEICRKPFTNWIKAEEKKFCKAKLEQKIIPIASGKEKDGVHSLDNAVERFSLASDAFLIFGYAGDHKFFKTFASDPLKADAVMYLQLMAMDLWAAKKLEHK